jgi:pimeloyl-ACP methyl ester carboxylesterase
MPSAHTPYSQIEYEAHGSPEHLALILLHGFPDSFRTWDGVIDNLKGARLRILVPHLRGFGATHVHHPEALSRQTAALAQDVLDFADALSVDRFVLVGHDWGASAFRSLPPRPRSSSSAVHGPVVEVGQGQYVSLSPAK